jgi:MFS family permease
MQGFLFSALSYGSSFTILFSGYLADLYGPRRVAMLALIVYFSLTLLSPLLAEIDFYAFLISRGVMGLAEVSGILQQNHSCTYLKPMPSIPPLKKSKDKSA